MSIKRNVNSLLRSVLLCGLVSGSLLSLVNSSNAATISYWNENTPALPNALFGYPPGSWPRAASFGPGSYTLINFDATIEGSPPNEDYMWIESFAGTPVNAQFGDPSGGSLSPEGGDGTSPGPFSNNGMSILFTLDTTGYKDISFSWAQRGTSTGFQSRIFSYSTDGGASYTPVAYAGDTGVLGATFGLESINLSSVSAVNNLNGLLFRITLDGATGNNGNNRFDNFVVAGTLIPEPAAGLLAGLALCAVVRRRKA